MSQRKVLKFIKDHMNNDCEKALSILEEAVSKKLEVKEGGRPKAEPYSEFIWYLYIWDRHKIQGEALENILDSM